MSSNVNTDPLDAYNPFAEPTKNRAQSGSSPRDGGSSHLPGRNPFDGDRAGGSVHTSLPTATGVPPSSGTRPSAISQNAILALERRQAELEAIAAELDRREKELEARMVSNQAQQASDGAAPHNWPPVPAFCPCRPCVRQDFDVDIPLDCQWMAKMGYYLWLGYTALLLLNMAGTLALFIMSNNPVAGPLFGASIVLLLVMPPLNFFAWHRPLYKALRSDSSFNYLLFFIFFTGYIIIVLIQCLGIDYLASCGWINGLKMCGVNKSVCALMLIVAALFTLIGALSAFLIFKVHRHYRSSGASIRKARLEMTSTAAMAGLDSSSRFGGIP